MHRYEPTATQRPAAAQDGTPLDGVPAGLHATEPDATQGHDQHDKTHTPGWVIVTGMVLVGIVVALATRLIAHALQPR